MIVPLIHLNMFTGWLFSVVFKMETEKEKLHKLLEQMLEDELQKIDQFMSDIHMEFDKCLSAGVLESEKTCVTRAKEEVIAPVSQLYLMLGHKVLAGFNGVLLLQT